VVRLSSERPVTVIAPSKGWRPGELTELWKHRALLWVLAMRDVKLRYKQTALGAAWAVLQPAMAMVIFTVIFGRLARLPADGYPYPVFVFSALVAWLFFANAVTAAAGSLVSGADLMNKVYFPRLFFPGAAVLAFLVDLGVSATLLLAMLPFYGILPSLRLASLPLWIGLLILNGLGVGCGVAALTVKYRDLRHVVPFMLQIWMYATPVVYSSSLIPPRWRWAFGMNPLAGIIDGFRWTFLGRALDPEAVGLTIAFSIGVAGVGLAYFHRVERRMADVI
jgi:lipopolysaccharide transport system permease protein